MRHEQHVTGFVVLIVEGIVIDVAQHGTRPQNSGIVLVEVRAQNVEKLAGGFRSLASGRDDGIELGGDGLPGVLLTSDDDLLGLQKVRLPERYN
jgi:hypothetical protein